MNDNSLTLKTFLTTLFWNEKYYLNGSDGSSFDFGNNSNDIDNEIMALFGPLSSEHDSNCVTQFKL